MSEINLTSQYRKWTLALLGFVSLTYVGHIVLWFLVTSHGQEMFPHCGDLARVGYLPQYGECRFENVTLKTRQLFWGDHQGKKIDIITIGDSFSRGQGYGDNNYYQDYIADKTGLNIIHFEQLTVEGKNLSLPESLAILHSSGFLRQIKPRHVIFEITEKNIAREFRSLPNYEFTTTPNEIEKFLYNWGESYKTSAIGMSKVGKLRQDIIESGTFSEKLLIKLGQLFFMQFGLPNYKKGKVMMDGIGLTKIGRFLPPERENPYTFSAFSPNLPSIMNINFKFFYSTFMELFGIEDYLAKVTPKRITKKMFSHPKGDRLLYIRGEKYVRKWDNDSTTSYFHETMEKIGTDLKKDGVDLQVLLIPNKYTLYQDLFVAKPDPEHYSQFFERIAKLKPKNYLLINAYPPLKKMIDEGRQDVFYFDDTHWTKVAIEEIVPLFPYYKSKKESLKAMDKKIKGNRVQ